MNIRQLQLIKGPRSLSNTVKVLVTIISYCKILVDILAYVKLVWQELKGCNNLFIFSKKVSLPIQFVRAFFKRHYYFSIFFNTRLIKYYIQSTFFNCHNFEEQKIVLYY